MIARLSTDVSRHNYRLSGDANRCCHSKPINCVLL